MSPVPPVLNPSGNNGAITALKIAGRDLHVSMAIEDLTTDEDLAVAPRIMLADRTVPALGGLPVIARIGKGAMGSVYLAYHPMLQSEIVIKVIPLRLVRRHPHLTLQLVRQARIASKAVSNHLVRVIDVGEQNEIFYMVREYTDGISVGRMLRGRKPGAPPPMNERQALETFIAATEGLAVAHSVELLHRDVKPDNILIPKRIGIFYWSETKLADLGLANGYAATATLFDSQILRTPGYMAPEQWKHGSAVGKPADVFGMGATLHAALSGDQPFKGNLADEATFKAYVPLKKLRPEISDELAAVIDRCLQREPEGRFANAALLLSALKECQQAFLAREAAAPKPAEIAAPARPVEPPPVAAPPAATHIVSHELKLALEDTLAPMTGKIAEESKPAAAPVAASPVAAATETPLAPLKLAPDEEPGRPLSITLLDAKHKVTVSPGWLGGVNELTSNYRVFKNSWLFIELKQDRTRVNHVIELLSQPQIHFMTHDTVLLSAPNPQGPWTVTGMDARGEEGLALLKRAKKGQKLPSVVIGDLTNTDCVEALERLTPLSIRVESHAPPTTLKRFQKMHFLALAGKDAVTAFGSISETLFRSLRGLQLEGSRSLKDLSPLRDLSGLTLFRLNSCPQVFDLGGLGSLTKLQRLDISHCQGIHDLRVLARLDHVQQVHITGAPILTTLSDMANLTKLQGLDVSACTGLKDIGALSKLRELFYVNFKGCDQLIDLRPLHTLRNLQALTLPPACTDHGLTALQQSGALNSARYLSLAGCTHLSDLAPLAELSHLTYLDLSGCIKAGSAQVEAIKHTLPKCRVLS